MGVSQKIINYSLLKRGLCNKPKHDSSRNPNFFGKVMKYEFHSTENPISDLSS